MWPTSGVLSDRPASTSARLVHPSALTGIGWHSLRRRIRWPNGQLMMLSSTATGFAIEHVGLPGGNRRNMRPALAQRIQHKLAEAAKSRALRQRDLPTGCDAEGRLLVRQERLVSSHRRSVGSESPWRPNLINDEVGDGVAPRNGPVLARIEADLPTVRDALATSRALTCASGIGRIQTLGGVTQQASDIRGGRHAR